MTAADRQTNLNGQKYKQLAPQQTSGCWVRHGSDTWSCRCKYTHTHTIAEQLASPDYTQLLENPPEESDIDRRENK